MKNEEKQEKQYVRKQYAADGTRSQKMMTFRCDNENIDWLESKPNKGRYINELIARDRASTSKNNGSDDTPM